MTDGNQMERTSHISNEISRQLPIVLTNGDHYLMELREKVKLQFLGMCQSDSMYPKNPYTLLEQPKRTKTKIRQST